MNESSPEAIPAVQANDRFAARLRGFGPLGILAILIILGGNFVIMPLSAILALIWAKISNTPWRELGYVRPGQLDEGDCHRHRVRSCAQVHDESGRDAAVWRATDQ